MIVLIHGDDLIKSREFLNSLKTSGNYDEVKVFASSELSTEALVNHFSNQSLIATKRLIIVENLFKNQSFDLKNLKFIDLDVTLVIWEDRQLPQTKIKAIEKQGKVYLFKLEALIFKYLSSIFPGNAVYSFNLLGKLLKNEDKQFIFLMLIKHFRMLILAKMPEGAVSLKESLADWQISRYLTQSRYYSFERLKKVLEMLLEIDLRVKSGMTFDFESELATFNYQLTKPGQNG